MGTNFMLLIIRKKPRKSTRMSIQAFTSSSNETGALRSQAKSAPSFFRTTVDLCLDATNTVLDLALDDAPPAVNSVVLAADVSNVPQNENHAGRSKILL